MVGPGKHTLYGRITLAFLLPLSFPQLSMSASVFVIERSFGMVISFHGTIIGMKLILPIDSKSLFGKIPTVEQQKSFGTIKYGFKGTAETVQILES